LRQQLTSPLLLEKSVFPSFKSTLLLCFNLFFYFSEIPMNINLKSYKILSLLVAISATFYIFSSLFYAHRHKFAMIAQNSVKGKIGKFGLENFGKAQLYDFVDDTKIRVLRATNGY
jgi:hypothetical protein